MSRHRRGAALAIAAIVLALLVVVTIGVASASGDDASASTQRLDALRAWAGAESARSICVRVQQETPDTPATGQFTLPDGTVLVIVQPFAASPASPGAAIVEGRFGGCVRRVEFSMPAGAGGGAEVGDGGVSDSSDDSDGRAPGDKGGKDKDRDKDSPLDHDNGQGNDGKVDPDAPPRDSPDDHDNGKGNDDKPGGGGNKKSGAP